MDTFTSVICTWTNKWWIMIQATNSFKFRCIFNPCCINHKHLLQVCLQPTDTSYESLGIVLFLRMQIRTSSKLLANASVRLLWSVVCSQIREEIFVTNNLWQHKMVLSRPKHWILFLHQSSKRVSSAKRKATAWVRKEKSRGKSRARTT